jgi:hypothetical protein
MYVYNCMCLYAVGGASARHWNLIAGVRNLQDNANTTVRPALRINYVLVLQFVTSDAAPSTK